MEPAARVYVAGAETPIGRALARVLARGSYEAVLRDDRLDLTDAGRVDAFFARTAPHYVFLVGGRSAGIRANERYPADLMVDNLLTVCHVMQSAHRHGVEKLLYLASSCMYPKECPQPMRVEALLTGPLEATSDAYAIAKLAGLRLCQSYRRQHNARFISGIAADVFGPEDDFDPENAHVVAALVRRMHEAKVRGLPVVEVWGSGTPRRDFLFADDLADACLFVMRAYDGDAPINLGGGTVATIRHLAERIRDVVGYEGSLDFDTSRPDGMPAKGLDWSPLRLLGWRPRFTLDEGLRRTYEGFLKVRSGSAGIRVP